MAVSLFAVNEGYLDDVDAKKVVEFEGAMQSHMKSQHAEFMDELNRDQAYNDSVVSRLHDALKDFKANGSW
jgi:F-type H+-transporting ATPase subunit alpha